VRVNRQVVGFKKIKFYTMENVGAGKLNMPEQEMHTTSFWLHFPAAFLARFTEFTPTEKQSGITGLGNALRTVAALLLMCDCRRAGGFRAQPLFVRCVSGRRGPKCTALSPGSGIAPPDCRSAGRVRLRSRLSVVCGPQRRDR
jgi:hypothetical protein